LFNKWEASLNLDEWIFLQARRSAAAMEHAISATHLVRRREAFGQEIRPSRGSVLASPVIANWDPEPDYFFHWLRDSAIVMRGAVDMMRNASSETERRRWRGHFDDFVRFSLALSDLDGAAFLEQNRYREAANPDFRKFLRDDNEIRALVGDRLQGEPRFNPDGTIDVFRWSRPQYDGPALRALACLRFLEVGGNMTDDVARLLTLDLDFTRRYAGRCCIGPWEEPAQNSHHYYVGLVQLAALVHGRTCSIGNWIGGAGREWERAEDALRRELDLHWSQEHQVYMAIRPSSDGSADDLLDGAFLLAILDAGLPDGPHSAQDERVRMTQTAIEDFFAREFPINRARAGAPALGRYRGDHYFGGGAWYPITLAAAELNYRLAQCPGDDRAAFIGRGDAFMATVRDLTPDDGALSEQVDRVTGQQTSARHLTWSYAAFVRAAHARARALHG